MRKIVGTLSIISFVALLSMGGYAVASHPRTLSDQFINTAQIYQAL